MNNTIAQLFHINPRFLRSVHIERDFSNPNSCSGYIPTEFTKSCLKRLAEGLTTDSPKRAWRLTGDYGTGKSSFALILAHLFSGHQNGLPDELWEAINTVEGLCNDDLNLLPILITGNRMPLSAVLLSALQDSLVNIVATDSKLELPTKLQDILNTLDNTTYRNVKSEFVQHETWKIPNIEDKQIIEAYIELGKFTKSMSNKSGVLLIIDELGKFLEYAAMYPEQQDIYLLQQLAEAANRSGNTPLFVLGLLHQGFNAYTDHLDLTSKKEWEKVATRFEEILFNQPLEQIVHVLSAALGIKVQDVPNIRQDEATSQMKFALKKGWYGPIPTHDGLIDKVGNMFPLDPLAVPVIVRTMYRFGQNERSLFSFLQSSEPFGLQDYASQHPVRNAKFYKIHNFYDYVKTNLSSSLSLSSMQTHWGVIDSIISSYVSENSLELAVLKTVGMLNLLNTPGLIPTMELVTRAVEIRSNSRDLVRDVIETLKNKKRLLYDRGVVAGLCLWQHTSVDLDSAYEKAERAVAQIEHVSHYIKDYLNSRPIVARRHYIETGNLRYFDIQHLSGSDFSQYNATLNEDADGKIIIVLCDSGKERQQALQIAKLIVHDQVIVAIPDPLRNVADYLRDFLCWEWVAKNTLELNTDSYARQEVSRQREAAYMHLKNRISDLIDLRAHSGGMRFKWFYKGEPLTTSTGKQLLQHLSTVCDEVFSSSPIVQTEIVNRQNLSTAGSGARMSLIRAMLEKEAEPNLGFPSNKRPPEMSIYHSFFKYGNIHVKGEKLWSIKEPPSDDDPCQLLPTLNRIEDLLKSSEDNKVSVKELFVELRKPPYGIRSGLIPLLFAIYYVAHRQEIAIFEDGTFLREVRGEDFYRLIRAPEFFEVQHSAIEGIRASVFDMVINVLGIQRVSDEQDMKILDIVQPLCTFVVDRLPEYVHNTKKLSKQAIKVRNLLMHATEPAPLLFRDLPIACEHSAFDIAETINEKRIQDFADDLKKYLGELKDTYTALVERLGFCIFDAFDVKSRTSQGRHLLEERARSLLVSVTEPNLKALCVRLSDSKHSEAKWIESVASFVTSNPPSYWVDSDEQLFQNELSAYASRFKHVENINFKANGVPKGSKGIRLSITHSDGIERSEVFYPSSDEQEELANIQVQIQDLLTKHKRLGMAAVAHAVWDELTDGSEAIVKEDVTNKEI